MFPRTDTGVSPVAKIIIIIGLFLYFFMQTTRFLRPMVVTSSIMAFVHDSLNTINQKAFLRFYSKIFEMNELKLLEHIEELFPRNYMYNNVCSIFPFATLYVMNPIK